MCCIIIVKLIKQKNRKMVGQVDNIAPGAKYLITPEIDQTGVIKKNVRNVKMVMDDVPFTTGNNKRIHYDFRDLRISNRISFH